MARHNISRVLRVERLEDRRLLAAANLVINEVMATNVDTLPDYFGEYNDWIEIRNLEATPINLDNYSLTDNANNLKKWDFPSTVIPAGGYLVVFASQPLDTNGEPLDGYVDPAGKLHTNFKIDFEGEYLGLTYEDPVTHAVSIVHEYAPQLPEQFPDYSFGIASDFVARYFDAPTPGSANGVGLLGVVADTNFSVDRGFFDAPFQLTISTDTSDATIYYTTDGSTPSLSNGTSYSGPLTIDRTTVLRAIAIKSGYVPTNVDTQTYLFLNDIVNQSHQDALDAGFPVNWRQPPEGSLVVAEHGFDPEVIGTFDTAGNPNGDDNYSGIYASTIFDSLTAIPTISIVMNMDDLFDRTTGIYINSQQRGEAWERPTSVEWITPDGSPEFQVDAGIRIQGGAFRSQFFSEKHSFRLLFKDEYGPTELEFPLFGPDAADEFNTVVIRTVTNDGYMWRADPEYSQYTRDEFGRSLQLDTGAPSPHNTWAHLYINGTYWGVYSPTERPDAEFSASYLGYNPDNVDVIHDDEANSGNFVAWNTMNSLAVSAANSLGNYMTLQGLGSTGADDPTKPAYLDVENYIDYLLINAWAGNDDWPHHNFWAARDKSSATTEGFQFFVWDFEGSMGNTREWSPLDARTFDQNWNDDFNAGKPHHFLKNNAEYRLDFADQVHKYFFNDGIFEPSNLIARYQEIADRVEPFIVAESARWGDMHEAVPLTLAEWYTERDWMLNTYLPQRTSYVMQELLDYDLYPDVVAPTFSQHGGQVAAGYNLAISAPAGTIYYTLDGQDPRSVGGTINPAAQIYGGSPIELTAGITVKARVWTGGAWSALNEAAFSVGATPSAANLAIVELNYHPAPHPGITDEEDLEFIEILNTGNQTLDISGVQIADFASTPYVFANGTMLAAGERLVVARNPSVLQSVYGTDFQLAASGYGSANFSNGGETVSLLTAGGDEIVSFSYTDDPPWPTSPDGGGYSLDIINPQGDANNPANWRASSILGGTPGLPSEQLLVGDFDNDSDVDGRDFLFWQRGSSTTPLSPQDLFAWQENYGSPEISSLATQVLTATKSDAEIENTLIYWISLPATKRIEVEDVSLLEVGASFEHDADRALEDFAPLTAAKLQDFGEMVARRNHARSDDGSSRFDSCFVWDVVN